MYNIAPDPVVHLINGLYDPCNITYHIRPSHSIDEDYLRIAWENASTNLKNNATQEEVRSQ